MFLVDFSCMVPLLPPKRWTQHFIWLLAWGRSEFTQAYCIPHGLHSSDWLRTQFSVFIYVVRSHPVFHIRLVWFMLYIWCCWWWASYIQYLAVRHWFIFQSCNDTWLILERSVNELDGDYLVVGTKVIIWWTSCSWSMRADTHFCTSVYRADALHAISVHARTGRGLDMCCGLFVYFHVCGYSSNMALPRSTGLIFI